MAIMVLNDRDSYGHLNRYRSFGDAGINYISKPSWWSNCVFLSHFDGSDGATTATDDSDSAHTITFDGDAELDTAQKKFGTASLLCTGSTPDAKTGLSSDLNLYGVDFTIDFWFYLPSQSMNDGLYGIFMLQQATLSDADGIICWNDNQRLTIRVNGTNVISLDDGGGGGAWNPSAGWHHFEYSREISTNTHRFFLDGVSQQSNVNTADIDNANHALHIGYGYPSYYWFTNANGDGQIDEVRVLKGLVAHTANFTPPTEAYYS